MKNRKCSPKVIDRIMNSRKSVATASKRRARRSVLSEDRINARAQMEINPVYQELAEIADAYGYELLEAYLIGPLGEPKIRFRNTYEKYKPEVIYEANLKLNSSDPMASTFEGHFKAQTTSFGMLPVKEYAKYAENVAHTYGMLKELEEVDISGLARIDM